MKKDLIHTPFLAVLLTAGFSAAWLLVSQWGVSTWACDAPDTLPYEGLHFRADGSAMIVRGTMGGRDWRATDLDGNPVPAPPRFDADRLAPSPIPPNPGGRQKATGSWEERARAFTDGQAVPAIWYFISDGRADGKAYFVGYDFNSRECVGYLGTEGFRDEMPPEAERIPFSGQSSCVLSLQGTVAPPTPDDRLGGPAPPGFVSPTDVYIFGRGGKVYYIDLPRRTVRLILDVPGLRSASIVFAERDGGLPVRFRLVARTEDEILVLGEQAEVRRRYPIPQPLRAKEVSFAETTTGEALMSWNSSMDSFADFVEHHIYWVPLAGAPRERVIRLAPPRESVPIALFGIIAPSPATFAGGLAILRTGRLLDEGLAATWSEAFVKALREFAPSLAVALGIASVFALLCYHRQRRYVTSPAARVLWPLFVLAFGLPGWVGYRFCRSWPALERCPGCGGVVPRDRGACARCEAAFPAPALRETEVFA